MSYATSDVKLLREIVDSAETRLSAQLTATLAADQRALVLAGFLVGSIVALLGGGIALLQTAGGKVALGYIALATAAAFTVSLALIIYTARPIDWYYPGTRPKDWISDISANRAECEWLADRAADCERKAAANAATLAWHSKFVMGALLLIVIALTIGATLAAICLL